MVTLAAISLIVNLGDDYETGNVLEYLPAYARDRHPADTWKQLVLKRCDTPELGREVSPPDICKHGAVGGLACVQGWQRMRNVEQVKGCTVVDAGGYVAVVADGRAEGHAGGDGVGPPALRLALLPRPQAGAYSRRAGRIQAAAPLMA